MANVTFYYLPSESFTVSELSCVVKISFCCDAVRRLVTVDI